MEKLEHFQHNLLFEFNRWAKAAEAARNICVVCRDNAIGESTARKWFSRFKEDEDRIDISDTPLTGRPLGFDDRLNTLIYSDTRHCTRELASVMNCDHHQSTPVVQGFSYSPLARFAGSIPVGVDGFFKRKNPEYDLLRKESKAMGSVS